MGNRAIVVFTDGKEYSCGIYLHWHGDPTFVAELIAEAIPRMRAGDVQYSAARFCGVRHENMHGNLSLGLVRPPTQQEQKNWDKYSQGNNGVSVVEVTDWTMKWFGQKRD